MIQSRFTSNTANTSFEFKRPEDFPTNIQTLNVSQVVINFETAPTTAGNIQIYYEDDAGKDLIWEAEAQSKTFLRFSPASPISIPNTAKLVIQYPNTDSVDISVRVIWST